MCVCVRVNEAGHHTQANLPSGIYWSLGNNCTHYARLALIVHFFFACLEYFRKATTENWSNRKETKSALSEVNQNAWVHPIVGMCFSSLGVFFCFDFDWKRCERAAHWYRNEIKKKKNKHRWAKICNIILLCSAWFKRRRLIFEALGVLHSSNTFLSAEIDL